MRTLFGRALAAVAVAIAALVVVSHHYHPFASHPTLLHVCGRDYEPSGATTTRAKVEASGVTPFGPIATSTDQLLGSSEVWGRVVPALGAIPDPDVCGPTVWLRTAPDGFKPFTALSQ